MSAEQHGCTGRARPYYATSQLDDPLEFGTDATPGIALTERGREMCGGVERISRPLRLWVPVRNLLRVAIAAESGWRLRDGVQLPMPGHALEWVCPAGFEAELGAREDLANC